MSTELVQFGTDQWFLDASHWYDMMLQNAPIYFEERSNTWNVFKFADVERALTQFSIFSSEFGGYQSTERGTGSENADIMGSMLTTDPPLHTKLRNIVSKSFSPSSIAQMEPRIREIASGLLKRSGTDEGHRYDHRFLGSVSGNSDCGDARDSRGRSKEIQKMVG